MSKQKRERMRFKLKCPSGHVDIRPANECRGKDNPVCEECFMPMMLQEVLNK